MHEFEAAYAKLNDAQKLAVDTIQGPLLVIAGPGTGKTQLLSARVAHILKTTDTLSQNILCLTFTESGAQNMRDRLTRFIGADAYDVAIGTYHAFGGDLIRRYPEYFTETRLERPVDELGKRQILSRIVDGLSYQSPLKQTRHHLGDLMSTVSETKRGLLTPDALRNIARSNLNVIEHTRKPIAETLADFTARMPSKLSVAAPLFSTILTELQEAAKGKTPRPPFKQLAELAAEQLGTALATADETGKTTPLTKWKNDWLVKDADNRFLLAGTLEANRIAALADVLESYEAALAERGLYDFDDMILRAIHVLETNDDLKFTLQEQYQYILLDEFQDTNAAQLRLVELLTDNPANNRQPNVLAVGDDDQAIYAFQGAQYSNMLDYFRLFDDVTVINLNENFRSTPEIVHTARAVADQITDTLSANFKDLSKSLVAKNQDLPATTLVCREYASEIAERAGIAAEIKKLLEQGIPPREIAVLAPKHRYLEPLVPYLADVPLRYERREDVLRAPVIRQLLTMSKLVLALHERNQQLADSYWPEVLSYDFWEFPVSRIWSLSWQAAADRTAWSELLLADEAFRPAALLFLSLAAQVETETLETMLDRIIGTEEVATHESDPPRVRSPLRASLLKDGEDGRLYRTVTELTVLRARLHEHQQQRGEALGLRDLLTFVAEYEAADEQMQSTSPYSEAADAVQLMTVFKAKGLEFSYVFLVSCQDDVWGNASRGNANKLTLPANLAPIRHAGATEDERLRIFFVGISRARHGLFLTSYRADHAGKKPPRLKYLHETLQEDGSVVSDVLPKGHQTVDADGHEALPLSSLETNWQSRHTTITPSLRELLRPRLETFRLSPTHLTSFIDLEHAGPQAFLLQTLLRFPTAPTIDLAFGNAMHETMEWLQQETNLHGSTPRAKAAAGFFATRIQRQMLTPEQIAIQQARAEVSLRAFLADPDTHFKPGDRPEFNFRDEGVFVGDVHMGGKIDLLQLDKQAKTLSIVDYKTGSTGKDPAKEHRYALQLYCYKLLIEGSHTFAGYKVSDGCLIFVEPDANGKIVRRRITFDEAEAVRVQALLKAIWQRIRDLSLPDIAAYGATYKAIRQFEQDLIDGKV